MKKHFFFALIFIPALLIAQKQTIELHPIVGETIDKAEKNLYFLFDDLDDSTFVSAYIYEEKNALWLASVNNTDTIISEIDSLYFSSNQQKIERIIEYFTYLQQRDSLNNCSNLEQKNNNINKDLTFFSISDKERKQIAKDARRYQALKSDAEQQGLHGVDKENYIKTHGYWEIYSSENKKTVNS